MNDEAYNPDAPDDLPTDLQTAVEHLKRRPIPQAAMRKALDRAAGLNAPARSTHHWPVQKTLLGFAAAIVLFIALGLWFLRPSTVWADVVKAVQAKPWIHVTGPDRSTNPGQTYEFWISTSQGRGGSRSKDQITFFDDRLQIIHRYDPQTGVLYRLPISTQELAQSQQFLELFQGLFRGDAELKAVLFPGTILKDQKRTQIEKDGQKWDQYDLHFQIPSQPDADIRMTFTVDAQTRLPHTMAGQYPRGNVEFTFDYPETGPADIYALGVPKDAKLIDRVPTGEMSRILAALQAGRDRFDDFNAVVIRDESPDVFPTAGKAIPVTFLVWKKGNRSRVETALPPQEYFGNHFPPGQDHNQWMRDMFKKAFFTTQYVCDGKAIYQANMRGDGEPGKLTLTGTADQGVYTSRGAMEAMPASWCYPLSFNPPNDKTEEVINLQPTDGPPNTILVTSRLTRPRTNEIPFERFWLDPTRGYTVVRHDLLNADPAKPPSDRDFQELMDQWEQTPGGTWYPTRVHTGLVKDLKTGGTWYHFYLDFKTDMADDLFKPAKRTLFTDRYPVAP